MDNAKYLCGSLLLCLCFCGCTDSIKSGATDDLASVLKSVHAPNDIVEYEFPVIGKFSFVYYTGNHDNRVVWVTAKLDKKVLNGVRKRYYASPNSRHLSLGGIKIQQGTEIDLPSRFFYEDLIRAGSTFDMDYNKLYGTVTEGLPGGIIYIFYDEDEENDDQHTAMIKIWWKA